MQCPTCHEPLEKRALGHVQVDECPSCKGVWFGKDELRRAREEASPDTAWMEFDLWRHKEDVAVVQRPILCPVCRVPLAGVEYANTEVHVDCCPKCEGVWLGPDEFAQIVNALNQELAEKTVPDYVRETLHEAAEIVRHPSAAATEWRDLKTVMRMLEYRILAENRTLNDALVSIQKISPFR